MRQPSVRSSNSAESSAFPLQFTITAENTGSAVSRWSTTFSTAVRSGLVSVLTPLGVSSPEENLWIGWKHSAPGSEASTSRILSLNAMANGLILPLEKDLPTVLEKFRHLNFDGSACIEYEGEEPLAATRKSAETIRKYLD